MLLNKGAAQIGEPDAFHAVAVDGRAPKFDGGIVTRLDSVPFGIVVNKNGERFYDEGEFLAETLCHLGRTDCPAARSSCLFDH